MIIKTYHLLTLLSLGIITISSNVLAMSMTTSNTNQRSFQFVPYGSSAPTEEGRKTISCDGRVPGTTLELTHWTNNDTPDSLYADTSTEIALNFATKTNDDDKKKFSNALIINNHYDTDGVLSVWACLEPQQALKYKQILIEGAEAGDFSEWNSDNGIKLDCAISEYCIADEEEAYEVALKELPNLLDDMIKTGGKSYEQLWRSGYDHAMTGWNDIQQNQIPLQHASKCKKIVIVDETNGSTSRLSSYALHRGLREKGLWKGTTRILRVTNLGEKGFQYGYEKIGHGWVQRLVQRHTVPNADGESIASKMNDHCFDGDVVWTSGGSSGLVSICQARCHPESSSSMTPNDVAELLSKFDDGIE